MQRSIRARSVTGLAAMLILLLGTSPADAKVIYTQEYPFTSNGGCIRVPQITCVDVPSTANKAIITFKDDLSPHVPAAYQVQCGTVPNQTTCEFFTEFCDSVEVVLPPDSRQLVISYEPGGPPVVEPSPDAPCDLSGGTTGTMSVRFR